LHRLGAGSSGEVWAARREGKQIAVKVLKKQGEARHEEAIRREMTLGPMLLGHPGVVAVSRVENLDGILHLEMDWVRGPNLSQVLWGWQGTRSTPALPPSIVVPWIVQVLETLQWAAQRVAAGKPHSFLHRDIKPANLLLDPRGRVRITDFGIARAEAELGFLTTETGIVKGSPRFMAPEVLANETIDWRADQFSTGVVLYELLSGSPLYSGREIGEVILKAVNADYGSAIETLDVPPKLRDVLRKMLSREIEDRYEDQHAAADALSRVPKPGPSLASVLPELLSFALVPDDHSTASAPGVLREEVTQIDNRPIPSSVDLRTHTGKSESPKAPQAPPVSWADADEGEDVTLPIPAPRQIDHGAATAALAAEETEPPTMLDPHIIALRRARAAAEAMDNESTALSNLAELMELQSSMAEETTALLPDPDLGEVPVPIRNDLVDGTVDTLEEHSVSQTVEIPRRRRPAQVPNWVWMGLVGGLIGVVVLAMIVAFGGAVLVSLN